MTLPRAAQWVLDRLLDPTAAEAIAGDLAEEYGSRIAAGRARLVLHAWLWSQVGLVLVNRALTPSRQRPSSSRRSMTETIWSEVRYAVRVLRRAPGFTLGAILPLALAIGLAASVFAAVHAVLLRDLPFDRADDLVVIGEADPGQPISTIGYETLLDLRTRAASFDGVAAAGSWSPTLTSPAVIRLNGMRVSAGFFSMLGVRPALGRDFEPGDDTPQTRRVSILSDALWRRYFGADPGVVGRTFQLNETNYRVVGVLPAEYEPIVSAHFYAPAEIWTPLGYAAGGPSSCRSCRHLRAIARLKPGISLEAAEDELRSLHAGLAAQYPSEYGDETIGADALTERIARPIRRPLLALLAAVLLVLAIAGANGASVMLARAADTEHEQVLRSALGASAWHLLRQRLVQAAVLAGAALIAGLSLAQILTARLIAHVPETLPRADHIALNGDVVLVSVGVTFGLCAAMAILPGWRSVGPTRVVTGRGRSTSGRGLVRLREALIVGDVAFALMLSIAAGLMVRSLDRLLSVDAGFDPTGVHTLGLSLVGPRWAEDEAVRAFQQSLIADVRALPGIDAAALTGQTPLGGDYDRRGGFLEERQTNRAEDAVEFERYSITPGYLEVMGVPLRQGRRIDDSDRTSTTPVMLINETAARQYWPGQDPIGRRVAFGREGQFTTVVGVVGDVRHYRLEDPPTPQMYMPQQQMTDSYLVMVFRSSRLTDVLPRIQERIRALGPDVPVYQVRSMEQVVSEAAARPRFLAVLLGFFALSAALMAAAGLYGVVAYMVSRRTREFGIRLALGAPVSKIRTLVVARGVALTATGVVLGLAGSAVATLSLRDQLFATSPLDPAAIAAGVVVLAVVTAAAHLVPVARATRVSPTVALRTD